MERAGITREATGLRGGHAEAVQLPTSTLGHLARVISGAHTRQEITVLLKSAGVHESGRGGASKRDFLYGVLSNLQVRGDHRAITRILVAVCDPRSVKSGTRDEINRHTSSHGLMFDADGRTMRVGQALRPPGADAQEFNQRMHHRLVAEHAGPAFAKGAYRGAVSEACKALESLVREKSGVEESGVRLMGRAFGEGGSLTVDMPGLASETVDSMQCGLMHMCMGIMSGVRNPVTHESEANLPVGRKDALEILGAISYLCGQVENMGYRPRRAVPKRGRKSSPGAKRDGAGKSAKGGSRGRSAVLPESGTKSTVAKLSVVPESVERGGAVSATVTGIGIDGWRVGVFSEEGEVKSKPTRLVTLSRPKILEGGKSRCTLSFKTLSYEPGEYRVVVSDGRDMDGDGARVKKFVVTDTLETEASEALVESQEAKDAVEALEDRVKDLERRERLNRPEGALGGTARPRGHEQGRRRGTLAAARRAVEADPNNADAHSLLADVLLGMGRWDGAAGALEAAVRLDASRLEDHRSLCAILRERGRHAEACKAHERASRMFPNDPWLHYYRGVTLEFLARERPAESGQLRRRAIVAIMRAQELYPHNPECGMALAHIKGKLEKGGDESHDRQ